MTSGPDVNPADRTGSVKAGSWAALCRRTAKAKLLDEDGSFLVAMIFGAAMLVGIGFWYTQVADAAQLRAQAQVGADSAAVAGAYVIAEDASEEIENIYDEWWEWFDDNCCVYEKEKESCDKDGDGIKDDKCSVKGDILPFELYLQLTGFPGAEDWDKPEACTNQRKKKTYGDKKFVFCRTVDVSGLVDTAAVAGPAGDFAGRNLTSVTATQTDYSRMAVYAAVVSNLAVDSGGSSSLGVTGTQATAESMARVLVDKDDLKAKGFHVVHDGLKDQSREKCPKKKCPRVGKKSGKFAAIEKPFEVRIIPVE